MSKISRRKLITTGLCSSRGRLRARRRCEARRALRTHPARCGWPLRRWRNPDLCCAAVIDAPLPGARVCSQPDFERSVRKRSRSLRRRVPAPSGGSVCGLAPCRRWHGRPPGIILGCGAQELPPRTQITLIACEEGWSYIAEWSGVPLSHILGLVGALPQARYVVYRSIQPDWWESIDMADALHPQTLVTLGMNGGELPVPFGGPLRMRVPRQLGYKNVKYITRLTLTDSLKRFGKGLGSASPEGGYAWYAGI